MKKCINMRICHIAIGPANPFVWCKRFRDALVDLGQFELVEHAGDWPEPRLAERMRQADVLVTSWGAASLPDTLIGNRGCLQYVHHVNGTVRGLVSTALLQAGLPVSNGVIPGSYEVAEGAVCLLLAVMKDLHAHIQLVRRDGWRLDPLTTGGSLHGLNVGIYGFGAIGRRFAELLRPFGCNLRAFDPYVNDYPDYVTPVPTLTALFQDSQAVCIHAALTDATRVTVTRELLALLPQHGVLINTARGGIVDQAALFDELRTGRLRAGLDVLAGDGDDLPPGHEARTWENLILTGHQIARGWPTDGQEPQRLHPVHEYTLENLRRFREGEPILSLLAVEVFSRST
ncbi:MAG: NAD(P)-dependent oxidoreductase [bacterium]